MAKPEMGAETSGLPVRCSGTYGPAIPDKLTVLLDRLKVRQRDLILAASEVDSLPARQIAKLGNAIAAVEAVADEGVDRQRRSSGALPTVGGSVRSRFGLAVVAAL